jgi:hypothetical protein
MRELVDATRLSALLLMAQVGGGPRVPGGVGGVFLTWAFFRLVNWGEKHCIRIPVAFRLYLVKITQILTN